jgi:FSR family fosmidomycin resistance protein-like MFS transporter
MDSSSSGSAAIPIQSPANRLVVRVLAGITIVHLLNDSIQAVIPAMFPILRQTLHLTYAQLGMIAFSNNITASLMQPLIGWYTDRKPLPFLLPIGMMCTLVGMGILAVSPSLWSVMLAVMLVGLGSAIFHPEGSRIVSLASGSRRGFGQSLFQLGGNTGSAMAPLMTIAVFVPMGQFGAIWFAGIAAVGVALLYSLSQWYAAHLTASARLRSALSRVGTSGVVGAATHSSVGTSNRVQRYVQRRIIEALIVLIVLTFARSAFISGINSFYALFQMNTFGVPLGAAQMATFVFLAAGAVGTIFGGTLADTFGKRTMLMVSMLGCAVFSWSMPFVSGFWAYPILALAGFCILTGFPVALLYALELMPHKPGMISGLMFGLAFGMGALGSVGLGLLADAIGIRSMMMLCCLLPLLGLFTLILPSDAMLKRWQAQSSSH